MKTMIKQWSNTSTFKALTPYLIFASLTLIIWFAGPQISFGDSAPFAETEKRIYAIITIGLFWILKIMFWDESAMAAKAQVFLHPQVVKRMDALKGRIEGALDFLRKTVITRHDKQCQLHQLPWYLLLGPRGSGKTTLLANSSVNFILSKQFKGAITDIPASDLCDWWVTRDLVLVDVPGTFLSPKAAKKDDPKSASFFGHLLWKNFLSLLNKHRGKRPIDGVVLTLPLPELLQQTPQNKSEMLRDLRNRYLELKQEFGNSIPLYITITKCDLLPGFSEFFGDSNIEEITQPWGITIPALKPNEKLIDAAANRINTLIKRLNKQLIWRLHQERNSSTRSYIKDFPLQIERLKEKILIVLRDLNSVDPELQLSGIYLTSAVQPIKEDISIAHTGETSAQPLQILYSPITENRPYFIKQLLLQGLLTHQDQSVTDIKPLRHLNTKLAFLIAGIATACLVILSKDIYSTYQQTVAIRDSLTQYHQLVSQQNVSVEKALPLLNALAQAAHPKTHSFLLYVDRAQQSAETAYMQALQTIVISHIQDTLENYLKTASNKNTGTTNAVLEAYLMLGDEQHMNSKFVIDTLQSIAPLTQSARSEEIKAHVTTALNTAWHPRPLNQDLIAHAKQLITPPSAADFAFADLPETPANNNVMRLTVGSEQEGIIQLKRGD